MLNSIQGSGGDPAAEPRIYLAVDNCFATKRWTSPAEWMRIAQEAGIYFVEASADTECDPLYTTPAYIADWKREIEAQAQRTGVRVSSLYSGHGSYATLGLAHTDLRVRRHMLDSWLKPMWRTAMELGAGLGFYCHAFADSLLQDPRAYRAALEELYGSLSELAAVEPGYRGGYLSLEQMYSPHQVPWTIPGTVSLMRSIYSAAGHPLYITIDTGHASGQRRFLRPGRTQLAEAIAGIRSGERLEGRWFGPEVARELLEEAALQQPAADVESARLIEEALRPFPYLFAEEEDGDPYAWIARLGCYSPTLHLQQTSGGFSRHLPFTAENNRSGIVTGEGVLEAIAESYARAEAPGMPPRVADIYLTIEMFAGTAAIPADIINNLRGSAEYWRRFIPEDGLPIGELVRRLH